MPIKGPKFNLAKSIGGKYDWYFYVPKERFFRFRPFIR